MDHNMIAATIRRLREEAGMTQTELAEKLCVSAKTISKWETAKGLPDITLIAPLANALKISVIELFSGECKTNVNRACNMRRSRFHICPFCGNIIHSTGEAVISCCGITLPSLEAEEPDEAHPLCFTYSGGEYHASIDHPMTKTHYITFLAYVTDSVCDLVKLYPEGSAEANFFSRGRGDLYCCCNQHGLFRVRMQPPRPEKRPLPGM